MKRLVFFMTLLLFAGCAYQSTLHVANYNVSPARVHQTPVKVAMVVPSTAYSLNKVFGSTTYTVPVGQYIRDMSRRFLSYAFQDIYYVSGKPYPAEADAAFIPEVSDFSFQGIQVALGFGMKFTANVTLKGQLVTKDGMIIWEGTIRSSKTSRSVVSPIIPVADMKSEAFAEALADCFRKMAEEIEVSGEIKRFASSLTKQEYTKTAAMLPSKDKKAWLGVAIQDMTAERARAARIRGGISGALVVKVEAGSSAERGGIKKGDIIYEVNSKNISTAKELADIVGTRTLNDYLDFGIYRAGTGKFNRYVKLGTREQAAQAAKLQAAAPAAASVIPVAAPSDEKLPPYREDAYAVVIGIDYGNRKDIPSLKYAASDAQSVYSILTDKRYGGIDPANTTLLLNDKATRNSIIASFRKLRTWNGYVYIYYSGHGAPITEGDEYKDAVLIPDDVIISDTGSMEETSVKLSYLQELVDQSRAKGVMVALDACFTGGGKSIVAKGGKPLVGMMMKRDIIKTAGTGKIILTSSAGNQQSWEDDSEYRSGIFSHFFEEGIKGAGTKNVWVNVRELASYVRENVAKAAMRLKGEEQEPQIIGKGDFAVSRNWERFKVMDAEMGKEKLRKAFEQGSITTDQLTRALSELGSSVRSKLLKAFLDGSLGGKQFGSLY